MKNPYRRSVNNWFNWPQSPSGPSHLPSLILLLGFMNTSKNQGTLFWSKRNLCFSLNQLLFLPVVWHFGHKGRRSPIWHQGAVSCRSLEIQRWPGTPGCVYPCRHTFSTQICQHKGRHILKLAHPPWSLCLCSSRKISSLILGNLHHPSLQPLWKSSTVTV